MGIVLEGHTPDELPERLLGSVRFTRVDMNPKCVLKAVLPGALVAWMLRGSRGAALP